MHLYFPHVSEANKNDCENANWDPTPTAPGLTGLTEQVAYKLERLRMRFYHPAHRIRRTEVPGTVRYVCLIVSSCDVCGVARSGVLHADMKQKLVDCGESLCTETQVLEGMEPKAGKLLQAAVKCKKERSNTEWRKAHKIQNCRKKNWGRLEGKHDKVAKTEWTADLQTAFLLQSLFYINVKEPSWQRDGAGTSVERYDSRIVGCHTDWCPSQPTQTSLTGQRQTAQCSNTGPPACMHTYRITTQWSGAIRQANRRSRVAEHKHQYCATQTDYSFECW